MPEYNTEWISVIEELGGHVLFLPPYSPDFNPIESAFSTIKAWLQICEITVGLTSSSPLTDLEIEIFGMMGAH